MQPVSAAEIQPAISLLGKTPQLLETLLGALPEELLQGKPNPDRCSISEVLAHLSALEAAYADRVRQMMAEDSPMLARYDLEGAKARKEYSRGSGAENLAQFARLRRSTAALLNNLLASAGARIGLHSELGSITLAHLLNEWASHDLGHLRQIKELYRAHAFHPNAGPFMKYSNPQP